MDSTMNHTLTEHQFFTHIYSKFQDGKDEQDRKKPYPQEYNCVFTKGTKSYAIDVQSPQKSPCSQCGGYTRTDNLVYSWKV